MGLARSQPTDNTPEQQLEMQNHQLERQIYKRYLMHQRLFALKIAHARELFFWIAAFYVSSSAALLAGYRKTKKPLILAPILPMTFILAYQGDLAYGSKLVRIKGEAENIMSFEKELLELPHNVPTVGGIDEAREKAKDEGSFNRAHDIFL
ncbi:plasminogen receptor (KT) [Rhipicephalus microplus]|uniref:plasminogen receptor (KT) n=1 Tax=Rhipicephalus microplus TaxID=6941 RepID=UPI003F6B180C